MTTKTLTLQLPREDFESAERYAKASGLTLAEFVARQIRLLTPTRSTSSKTQTGLASLARGWDDSEDFAVEFDRINDYDGKKA